MIPLTQVNSVSIAVLRESVVESAGVDWEREVIRHLEELTSAEQEMLKLLGQKHALLARGDEPALASMHEREETLLARLTACQERRCELLARAGQEDRPADSIATLAIRSPGPPRPTARQQVEISRGSFRLLQNESLANWVLAQRLLVHVSQWIARWSTTKRSDS